MANALFNSAKELLLTGQLSWMGDDIRVALVRGYTFNATHDYLDDVTGSGATVVATLASGLTGKSATGGVADADDIVFGSVTAGAAIPAVVFYREAASDALRALIAYFDVGSGLPVTPNGTDVNIVWDNGSNRIFRI
jgi:hypothetical protein